jgi:hypothetical protein
MSVAKFEYLVQIVCNDNCIVHSPESSKSSPFQLADEAFLKSDEH